MNNKNMSSAIVTGSDGFVGRALVQELKKKKVNVIGIDKASGKDITRWQDIASLPKTDVVFHLAAVTFIPFCMEHPRETYEINTLGTLNMLEYCRKNDAKLVYASSYVYGAPKYLPVDEKHPIHANNPYSRSKVLAETLCREYYDNYGLKSVILRPFNVYGAGQRDDFLIPSIIKQIKESGIVKLDDPEPKRDFIHVKDMVSAYIKAAKFNGFDYFNIGSGKSYSVREIVDKLVKLSNKKVKMEFRNKRRKDEVMDCYADIRKAKELLDWQPTVDFDEGLNEVYIT